jgi:hypothetical protein
MKNAIAAAARTQHNKTQKSKKLTGAAKSISGEQFCVPNFFVFDVALLSDAKM